MGPSIHVRTWQEPGFRCWCELVIGNTRKQTFAALSASDRIADKVAIGSMVVEDRSQPEADTLIGSVV